MYRDNTNGKSRVLPSVVLILVLVEYTVTAILVLRASSMKGLNPCFSGIYRDLWQKKAKLMLNKCLNPCFSGIYRDCIMNLQGFLGFLS